MPASLQQQPSSRDVFRVIYVSIQTASSLISMVVHYYSSPGANARAAAAPAGEIRLLQTDGNERTADVLIEALVGSLIIRDGGRCKRAERATAGKGH
eukprot:COSAG03_NODE_2078_length_3151_cov_4.109764_3_plen_97_part_00